MFAFFFTPNSSWVFIDWPQATNGASGCWHDLDKERDIMLAEDRA